MGRTDGQKRFMKTQLCEVISPQFHALFLVQVSQDIQDNRLTLEGVATTKS